MTFKEYFYLIKKAERLFEEAHLRYDRGIDSPEEYNREAARLLNIKGYLIRRANRELE